MNVTFVISPESWYIKVSSVYVIFLHVFHFLVSLPLNFYLIFHLTKRREGMEVTDIITLNQALAEISFVFIGPFYSLCSFGPSLCLYKPMGFMLGLSLCSRGFFQCSMCLMHYIAVVHPLTFLRLKPVRYRIACCVVGWTIALVFGVSCLFTFPDLCYYVYALVYVLILVVSVFCCVSILKKLRHPGPGDRMEKEMNSSKKKAFQVVCMNLVAFLIQVIPITISFGLRNSLTISEFSLAVVISLVFCISGGFVQPVFLLHKAGKLSLTRNV